MSDDRVRVASVDDFEDASRVVVDVEGREIAVFRTDDGFYALSNYCVHQGGPACEGAITGTLAVEDGDLVYDREGEVVSCPWHGWEFDVTTGEHLADPAYRLPTYEVERDGGELYVR
ncbi:MAG: Rieske (2Fe-2S) protein [Haloferacaceae archaeon]